MSHTTLKAGKCHTYVQCHFFSNFLLCYLLESIKKKIYTSQTNTVLRKKCGLNRETRHSIPSSSNRKMNTNTSTHTRQSPTAYNFISSLDPGSLKHISNYFGNDIILAFLCSLSKRIKYDGYAGNTCISPSLDITFVQKSGIN